MLPIRRNRVSFRVPLVFSSLNPSPMTSQDSSFARESLSHQAFLGRLAIDLVGGDADDLVQEVCKTRWNVPAA